MLLLDWLRGRWQRGWWRCRLLCMRRRLNRLSRLGMSGRGTALAAGSDRLGRELRCKGDVELIRSFDQAVVSLLVVVLAACRASLCFWACAADLRISGALVLERSQVMKIERSVLGAMVTPAWRWKSRPTHCDHDELSIARSKPD